MGKNSSATTVKEAPASGPDLRREQMLRAAVEVICERGFSDTRISDVATRADASPALVIYYFGTKDGLLVEAMRWAEDQFYDATEVALAKLDSARERLATLVRVTCVRQSEEEVPGAWGLWLDLWVQAFRHPEVARDRIAMDQRWREVIARIVREGQAGGEFRDADVDDFAIGFSAMIDGLSIQMALEDPDVDNARAMRIGMEYADSALVRRDQA